MSARACLRYNLRERAIELAAPALFLGLWELIPHAGGLLATFVVPPTQVAATLAAMAWDGELWIHIALSARRALSGFLLACVIGIPLGYLLSGRFRTFAHLTGPVIAFLGKVNPFSILPLFVVLFGIGETSKTLIVFWSSVWPVMLHTATGVREVDPILVKMSQSLGCGPCRLFFHVVLPGASPGIARGVKLASGTAFFMVIAAEMIGSSAGLGWLVWNAQLNFLIPRLFAATVTIATLGLFLNAVLVWCERRLFAWREA
jgi:NitT/TauT family transport system permease protein